MGVGFGRQKVLNNNASGLRLLAERPIQAGDLIILAKPTKMSQRLVPAADSFEMVTIKSSLFPTVEWDGDQVWRG